VVCEKCKQDKASAMRRSTPIGKSFWDQAANLGVEPVLCDRCCASYPWRAWMKKERYDDERSDGDGRETAVP